MNENILDLLLYLFHNYRANEMADSSELRDDLDQAGFLPEEVNGALDWLRSTETGQITFDNRPGDHSTRVFCDHELICFSASGQGCLHQLQHHGILSGETREIVIDRLLALADANHAGPIDDKQIQWVTMMVLSSRGEQSAGARMQALMRGGEETALH